MNKKTVLADLAAVANMLDEHGAHEDADVVTDVMERVSQTWWQNDAGEPMYSPEAIRAEERADSEREYNPDDYLHDERHSMEDDRAEEQGHNYEDVFDNWAASQQDLPMIEQKLKENEWAKHQQNHAGDIEQRKQKFPDTFNEEQYLKNNWFEPDLKSTLEGYILGNSSSVHRDTWFDDPDTMHNILDAAKSAIINGTDIMSAVNSIPANGQDTHYPEREDFGWGGDERWLGE